jgi:homoserine dehydrogenase
MMVCCDCPGMLLVPLHTVHNYCMCYISNMLRVITANKAMVTSIPSAVIEIVAGDRGKVRYQHAGLGTILNKFP